MSTEDFEVVRNCIQHNCGDSLCAAPDALARIEARLAGATTEGLEQARLNGMGSEREARLMARLREAERERDALRWQVEHSGCATAREGETTYECRVGNPCGLCRLRQKVESAERERDALRVEVERLTQENQKLRRGVATHETVALARREERERCARWLWSWVCLDGRFGNLDQVMLHDLEHTGP